MFCQRLFDNIQFKKPTDSCPSSLIKFALQRKKKEAVQQKLYNDIDIIHLQNLATKYKAAKIRFYFENLEKLSR